MLPIGVQKSSVYIGLQSELYAEKTFDDKPCKSTLVCASRKALAFRRDTDKVRPARVSCRQKEIGIN